MMFKDYAVLSMSGAALLLTLYQFAFVIEDVTVAIPHREVSANKVTLWVSMLNAGTRPTLLSDLQLRVIGNPPSNLRETDSNECETLAADNARSIKHSPDEPNWPSAGANSMVSRKLEYTFIPPFSKTQFVGFCLYIEITDVEGNQHSIIRDGFSVRFNKNDKDGSMSILFPEEHNLIFDVVKRTRRLFFR